MATVIIEGTGTLDGEFEFDFARRRTARELYHYKQVAKHGWDDLDDAIREGSLPLVVAGIATLALVRAGKVHKTQALHIGEFLLDLGDDDTAEATVRLILDPPKTEEAEAVPPETAPTPNDKNESPGAGNDEQRTPGSDSAEPSAATQETTLTDS